MSAPPPDMISIREFARRDGCSEKRVRNAIQTRHLPPCPGKLLPPTLVGTGWREGNRGGADTPRTVRTKVSARPQVSAPEPELLPSEACSLSAMVVGGAQDLAVLLLRLGLARAAVTEHVDGWLAQQRVGAVDCMTDDVPPPAGHDTWSEHPLFVGPWQRGTSWSELEALAANAQD
ncbi:MAG: hypothetical protein ACRYG8_36165 [Janthinobacterium lividum]